MNPINTNYYVYLGVGIAVFIFTLFGAFYALNNFGIATTVVRAKVLNKKYTPEGTTYRTTVVNNQSIVQPQKTAELYAVVFDIDGEQALGLLTQKRYESLEIGDEAQVSYRRTRLTRQLKVLSVNQ